MSTASKPPCSTPGAKRSLDAYHAATLPRDLHIQVERDSCRDRLKRRDRGFLRNTETPIFTEHWRDGTAVSVYDVATSRTALLYGSITVSVSESAAEVILAPIFTESWVTEEPNPAYDSTTSKATYSPFSTTLSLSDIKRLPLNYDSVSAKVQGYGNESEIDSNPFFSMEPDLVELLKGDGW